MTDRTGFQATILTTKLLGQVLKQPSSRLKPKLLPSTMTTTTLGTEATNPRHHACLPQPTITTVPTTPTLLPMPSGPSSQPNLTINMGSSTTTTTSPDTIWALKQQASGTK